MAHEIIVRMNPEVSTELFVAHMKALGAELVDAESPLSRELGYLRLRVDDALLADEAISDLLAAETVALAERHYLAQASLLPDDSRFEELWGLKRIGMPEAWDRSTGSREIVVAISDTGIDVNHPDLAANVWVNPGEIPGNNLDDDHNGYVDDVHGYNFANRTPEPIDDNGHGTHVAGTVGAVGDDGRGVVGVNWNVRLQGLKFLGKSGSGGLWEGAATILYAAKMGAHVVNASWGCKGCKTSIIEDAIRALHEAGGIFVAAAGNSADNIDTTPHYPAAHTVPNMITVAAIGTRDELAYFSNYGAGHTHIAAPGRSILSTLPGNRYAFYQGTSMAAPHVAGAAALFLARNPGASVAQTREAMFANCEPLPSLAGKVSCGGLLNVAALLDSDDEAPAPVQGLTAETGPSAVTLRWEANQEPDLASYWIRWGVEQGVYGEERQLPASQTSFSVAGLEDGRTYYFALQASDDSGNRSAPVELAVPIQDTLAPPPVIDLRAEVVSGARAPGRVVASSGAYSAYYDADYAYDLDPTTAWLSPPRSLPQEEYLIVELGERTQVGRLTLRASAVYPEYFPSEVDLEVSLDGNRWQAVTARRGLTAPDTDEPLDVVFVPAQARLVRLRMRGSSAHPSGFHYLALSELAVYAADADPAPVRLRFTAPGDDPGSGRAASYDLRTATAPISEESFADAVAVQTPAPRTAGVLEEVVVTHMSAERDHYFALRATDDAGNVSPLSNVAQVTMPRVPPAPVLDLVAQEIGKNKVTLGWTAPADNGGADAVVDYDLRVAPWPIDEGNFYDAERVPTPAPAAPGSWETAVAKPLPKGEPAYFALRSVDALGIVSALSNVVLAVPGSGDEDAVAPATVRDLVVMPARALVQVRPTVRAVSSEAAQWVASQLLDDDLLTGWASEADTREAPAWVELDLGDTVALSEVHLRAVAHAYAQPFYPENVELLASADGNSWLEVSTARGLAPSYEQGDVLRMEPVWARYLRLHISRRNLGFCLPDQDESCARATVIAELAVFALTPEQEAELAWVAPGDDGWVGTASGYELRMADAPLDEHNFAQGALVPTPAPEPGGRVQHTRTAPLAAETRYHFRLRAFDERGNQSDLSNEVVFETPAVPPAAVTDLRVLDSTPHAVRLRWTASGDDGRQGRASRHELRYAQTPIRPSNWEQATPVTGLTAPQPAGSAEQAEVPGLDANTTYYFALRVYDDTGAGSLLSNNAVATTGDDVPPERVVDLTVSAPTPGQAPPLAVASLEASSSYSQETAPRHLLDGSADTLWLSGAHADGETATLELHLEQAVSLARLRLEPADAYVDLFPRAFEVQVRDPASRAWITALRAESTAAPGDAEELSLGAVTTDAVRLVVTDMGSWTGARYAALAELALFAEPAAQGAAQLRWTAPEDQGPRAQVDGYDLRRAGEPITPERFARATPLAGPTPSAPGTLERHAVEGLEPGARHCFALTSRDAAGNTSPVSNSACVELPAAPPRNVTDLHVTDVGPHHVDLAWSPPPGEPPARYEVRYAAQRIGLGNWDDALVAGDTATPALRVAGLDALTEYFFAVRSFSAGGSASGVSNNASARTLDDVPPTAVTDLRVHTDGSQPGSLQLRFTAPGDNGPVGTAAAYDVRVSRHAFDEAGFDQATPVAVDAPAAGGSAQVLTLSGLDLEASYYVALKARDAAGNWSAMSNLASGRTRDEAPGQVLDLAFVEASGDSPDDNTAVVRWTAPGDNGDQGQAASYELRVSDQPISLQSWERATLVPQVPAPAPAGTPQEASITGLAPGADYFVALRARDARDNLSPLSNVLAFTTPDLVPPARVSDLRVEPGSGYGQLVARWTATGDDGARGRADRYELRWASAPITAANFDAATPVETSAPGAAGSEESVKASDLPDEQRIYVALRVIDDAGNVSPLSDSASARTLDRAPGSVRDLHLVSAERDALVVGFTAPGDDEQRGRAARYELRYADRPINADSFELATPVPTAAPQPAGSAEQVRIEGLAENRAYFVALRAVDERDNVGALSSVLRAETADTQPPAQVVDLRAETGAKAGSVRLRWTAPGDDDQQGQAARYDVRYAERPIDDASWGQATPVAATPKPRSAGSAESLDVTGLVGERRYYFALRAVDEAGNAAPLSPSASADTPPVPPAAITSLRAEAGPGRITLRWTAPGDDGAQGTARAYDLRMDTALLTASSFFSAPKVSGVPTPSPAGSEQVHVIEGLPESTTYWLAIKAEDDAGGVSDMSNVVRVTTPDLTAPAAPTDLVVRAPSAEPDPFGPASAQASSTLGPRWSARNAVDRSPSAAWASAASALSSEQSLTADLGSVQRIDRIRALPDASYPGLFPRGLTFALSTDGSHWQTVATERDFGAPDGDSWLTWGFAPRSARYVRLTATETRASFGRHYAIVAELDVLPARPDEGQVELYWIAPGDDGARGTAARYQIFHADVPFDGSTLDRAQTVEGPAPGAAGSLQSFRLTGLPGEQLRYWAVRALDEAGNAGPLSAVVAAETNPVSPGVVQDLSATATGMHGAALGWTAPGDDGQRGLATRYELRYAPWPLTSANFPLATLVPTSAPRAPGELESLEVSGLDAGTTYRFALVAFDERDNASYLSNIAVVSTAPAPDVTAPATVEDLQAALPSPGGVALSASVDEASSELLPDFSAAHLHDNDRTSVWSTAPQVDDAPQSVRLRLDEMQERGQLRLWPAAAFEGLFPRSFELRVSPDGLAWETVLDVDDYADADADTPVVAAVTGASFQYVELYIDGLTSHDNGFFYAAASELEVVTLEADPGSVQLSWTAPGDDGFVGEAVEYDLRVGACPYDHAAATPLVTWAPAPPGTPERTVLSGLSAGEQCFGLTATDDEGNTSALSNVARVTLP